MIDVEIVFFTILFLRGKLFGRDQLRIFLQKHL